MKEKADELGTSFLERETMLGSFLGNSFGIKNLPVAPSPSDSCPWHWLQDKLSHVCLDVVN